MQVEPINTAPVEDFIKKVKTAEISKSTEIRININDAKALAFCLGVMSARLYGELEKLVVTNNNQEEVIQVTMDGGRNW